MHTATPSSLPGASFATFTTPFHHAGQFRQCVFSRSWRVLPSSFLSKACGQLSQMIAAARWIPPRKVEARLSYRIAMARYCLSFTNKFSIKRRALYISSSYSRGFLRFDFGGMKTRTPAFFNRSRTRSAASYALSARKDSIHVRMSGNKTSAP
mgnify:CR=1 FL=1